MASRDPAQPNVVFVLSDDQGPWALGCAGNSEIQTPNLNRLAAEGTRFDRFFCASPVCSPARASILTGRMPSQHGVHDWVREGNVGAGAVEYLAGQTGYTELLAGAGYQCGLSGKWHLGDSQRPQKGFTHWYAHQSGGGSYYGASVVRDGRLVEEPGYLTDAITDDALGFLDRNSSGETPFYLSVHYTAPHSPWIDQHPREYVDLYRDCDFASCPDEPTHPWVQSWSLAANDHVRQRRRDCLQGYFAAVTAMDDGIGRIVDRLDRLGVRDSTLIWFLSDNGFSCGHHGFWGKGNGTFPQNMYDNSVLVPAIMSQPGRIPAGVVDSSLLSGYDVLPTLLDHVGVDLPADIGDDLPGRSFTSLLAPDGTGGGRDHVVVYDEYGPVRMIRTEQWKYVHRYPDGPHELYDMRNDPDERANLAGDSGYRKAVDSLAVTLEDWFARYTDPRLDGTRQPVTGNGQRTIVGPRGTGAPAFFTPDEPMPPREVTAEGQPAPSAAARPEQ